MFTTLLSFYQFSEYLAQVGQICVAPGQCAADYMQWFYMISNPFMSSAQARDPPRHPRVLRDDIFIEPNIPQHQVAATAMDKAPADSPAHVEQPRHAVVKYIFNCDCYSFYLNMH